MQPPPWAQPAPPRPLGEPCMQGYPHPHPCGAWSRPPGSVSPCSQGGGQCYLRGAAGLCPENEPCLDATCTQGSSRATSCAPDPRPCSGCALGAESWTSPAGAPSRPGSHRPKALVAASRARFLARRKGRMDKTAQLLPPAHSTCPCAACPQPGALDPRGVLGGPRGAPAGGGGRAWAQRPPWAGSFQLCSDAESVQGRVGPAWPSLGRGHSPAGVESDDLDMLGCVPQRRLHLLRGLGGARSHEPSPGSGCRARLRPQPHAVPSASRRALACEQVVLGSAEVAVGGQSGLWGPFLAAWPSSGRGQGPADASESQQGGHGPLQGARGLGHLLGTHTRPPEPSSAPVGRLGRRGGHTSEQTGHWKI